MVGELVGDDRVANREASQRLTVQEAAEVLGISVDAVRHRIRRGSLDSEKAPDGRVFVWLASGEPNEPKLQGEASALVEELRDQVGYLREQLGREQDAHAEARRIIAALTSRIPQLEAPRELQGSPESPGEAAESPKPLGAGEGLRERLRAP